MSPSLANNVVRIIDMVFPGDTNHHGTLFGGVALAHMDKVAFLAASRHGRAAFVTASSDRIDFAAPAHKGELIEATGRVVRVGSRSLDVEVELVAEALLSGERRLCTRGLFTLVAVRDKGDREGQGKGKGRGKDARANPSLPPLPQSSAPTPPGPASDTLHMVDMVFPPQTNHYGTLFGGDALKMLGKAAFIAATRHARATMVMASSNRVDFRTPVEEGQMIELITRIKMTGRTSLRVGVELWAENLLTGERACAAKSEFVMVAVGCDGRPTEIGGGRMLA